MSEIIPFLHGQSGCSEHAQNPIRLKSTCPEDLFQNTQNDHYCNIVEFHIFTQESNAWTGIVEMHKIVLSPRQLSSFQHDGSDGVPHEETSEDSAWGMEIRN